MTDARPTDPPPRGRGGWTGALAIAVTLAVALSGATQFAPLFPIYAERGILTTLLITIVFAVYVGGTLLTLFAAQNWSRRFGRRAILAMAMACVGLADIAFFFAQSPWLLLVGRVFSGAGVGAFVAIGSLALIDQVDEDGEGRATLLASCANVFGLGSGSLLSGLLVIIYPAPLQTPFLVHGGLAVLAFALLALAAPTIARDPERTLALSWPSIHPDARAVFTPAAIAAFAAFSVSGFFGAISPSFLEQELGVSNALVIGTVAALVFLGALVGNVLAEAIPARLAPVVGAAVLLVGVAVVGAGLHAEMLAVLAIGATIGGIGNGTVLQSGLRSIKRASPTEAETEAVTLFFAIGYTGLAIPILGAGIVQGFLGLRTTALAFTGAIAALVIVAIVWLTVLLRRGETGA